ncbi:DUF5686 and carboxypeptidase regulatory-like domain-containing protein [Mucilaginibacter calamicampi]|uniref:DUF5686 and carboxypeptidase regulatory-like domain-containing protein n=1 Tax=Mucilaginibacter calamicampi TaxID=1302352 RepID=A0ABW2Z0Q5_9SPHI
MKIRLLLLYLFLTAFIIKAEAQQFVLSGRIVNEQNKPVSFVSIYIRNSTYGTTTNDEGNYTLKLEAGTYKIVYRFVGFKEQTQTVTIAGQDQRLNIKLEKEIYQPRAIDRQARNGRDTSAMNIMQKVIDKRQYYLNEVNSYSCSVYIKGVQKLIDAPNALMRGGVANVLSLDSNGKGVLYQSEMLSTFTSARPNKIKEETIAQRMAGITPSFSYSKASDLSANFYDNIFAVQGLSSRGFVSPIASNAFSYYRYKLVGTAVSNGKNIDKIELIPKHAHDPVFRGHIYIVEGDWRLYSVDLVLTDEANFLNLVDTMRISQQYVPIRDSTWMPSSIEYDYSGNVFGFKFEGYYIGLYNNYKFDLKIPDGYFTGEILRIDTAANVKTPLYWTNQRPVPLTRDESVDARKRDSIVAIQSTQAYQDSLQRSNNHLSPLPYLVTGHTIINRAAKDTLYLYPFLQTFFYNTVEGWGVNARVRYSKLFDDYRSYSVSPSIRYGTANKLLSANVRSSYTYDLFNAGMFFFDAGSDVLDLNNAGTRSLYFNTLSTLLSERNFVKYYRSVFGNFGWQREVSNGIRFNVNLGYSDRTQLFNNSYNHIFDNKNREFTSNNPLAPENAPADDRSILFPQHQALTLNASVRFTFAQPFITRPTGRIFLQSAYPVLTVNYRKGISGVLGSDVNYDFTSVTVTQDRIRLGLTGYSSFKLAAGTFLNKKTLYFPDFYHFIGNQGTTFDPTDVGSFHFLPFYRFSANSSFVEAHYQHNFSGSILRRIPFVRRLKLEEIVGANYLTMRNNPNYSEFYVGIQRLIFRVDYGISFTGNQRYIQGIRLFYGIR